MKLITDFKSDWHELLKSVMANKWDMDTSDLDKEIPVHYFNAQQRRIPARPRQVSIADIFECPAEHQAGWNSLQQKITQGQDLSPHLSKFIDDVGKNDLMLSDWGVYHLHLGTKLKGRYINRTGPLLFARVTGDSFYAISVYTHDDWTDAEIVEAIHRNWPESIACWALQGMQPAEKLTSEQRKALRGKRYNSFVQVKDGTTYAPVGGGYMFSGHSIFAITEMDKEHDFLECLERLIPDLMTKILPELEKRGYSDASDIRVSLVLTDLAYFAHFTEYGIATELQKRHPGPWRDVVSKNAQDLR